MPQVPPAARVVARRVLLYEAGGRMEPAALTEAAARADARLRGRLADLIGLTGYTTLLARAVRLAQADIPALKGVTVVAGEAGEPPAEGSLRGVPVFARASGDVAAIEAGLSAILAHAIGLLITFIGEDLALRLVHEAWPELASDPAAAEGHA
ncbi:MAG: hypothetical protein LC769_06090 [Chloroflexi bacterium]|nr:hypothetical protein [Chloroflexota bacterium]